MLVKLSLEQFSEQLADNNPTPGGGSASALAGALGASLVAMFCNVTAGRKKYAHIKEEMEEVAAYAGAWRQHLLELVDKDSQAFEKVLAANKMPKDAKDRQLAMDAATLEATRIPLQTASSCVAVLEKIPPLAAKGNPNAISDLNVGMELLNTAFHGAMANVQINLPWLPQEEAGPVGQEVLELAARAQKAVDWGREQIAAQ